MKRLSKPISIIIVMLILTFSYLSVFGISYYEGDFKKTPIKGFGDLDWGLDTNGGVEVTYCLSSADEASVSSLDSAASVIEKRITDFGLVDYDLYLNKTAQELTFVLPNNIDSDMNAIEIAELIALPGYLTLRPDDYSVDTVFDSTDNLAYFTPDGTTANEIILSSAQVKNSSWYKYSEDGFDYYYVTVDFDEEGTELLKAVTSPETGRFYNNTVSVWLDNRMLANPTVNESIENGSIQFTAVGFSESKAKLYSAIIDNGVMPSGVTIKSYNTVEPTVDRSAAKVIMFTGLVASVLLLLFMVAKYRLTGLVGLICALFEFSVVLAFITGFCFGGDGTYVMTIPGACSLAIASLLPVISTIIIGERVNKELSGGAMVIDALTSGFKKGFKNILDINMIFLIISLMGMLMFGTADLTIGILSGGAVGSVFNFCFILFLGSLLNFINGYILPSLILRSCVSFKKLNKPSVFGGVRK